MYNNENRNIGGVSYKKAGVLPAVTCLFIFLQFSVLFFSCRKQEIEAIPIEQEKKNEFDSVSLKIMVGNDTVAVNTKKGTKRICIIANMKNELDPNSVFRYESLEQTCTYMDEEDPLFPIKISNEEIELRSDTLIEARLRQSLCEIELSEITNSLGGYTRLEDPRIFLLNFSEKCEIFKETGHFPSVSRDTGAKTSLPCDIGILPQKPKTKLYCYPDESARTEFMLECEIKGETRQYKTALPVLLPGSRNYLTIDVLSEESCSMSVFPG